MNASHQFTVDLDPTLVRRLEDYAADAQLSLSEFVSRLLSANLDTSSGQQPTERTPPTSPGIMLQPMVHVDGMSASVRFYEALGARVLHGNRDGDFVMLQLGDGQLSLLAHPPNPAQGDETVELNFEASDDLAGIEARLVAAGVDIDTPTTDQGFGRQLIVRSPDGLLIKINELNRAAYT